MQNNKFWEAQIEQIHVLSDKDVELVPRVGDHIIYLGKLDGFERKLERMKAFYEKGLNQGRMETNIPALALNLVTRLSVQSERTNVRFDDVGRTINIRRPIH